MKNSIQTLLLAVVAMFSVNLLISCAPQGKSDVSAVPVSAKSVGLEGGQKSPTMATGTSDSGGGTGIDGKVFESYIVDPTQLPAYKQHLEPLLKNIKSKKQDGARYDQVLKMKTWYIAPVDLSKVSKDVLGVSFMKSATQQIARQTQKEVWIDQRIYDQMNGNDQADLILHELVMTMYFFKFMTMSEMCKLAALDSAEKENEGCVKDREFFDKTMPPAKAHPLTDQDNENIRFVTGWLKQNAQKTIAEKDFIRILFYKGFDKRLFRPENYGEKPPSLGELKISKKEFYQVIRGAELSGHMPEVCFAATNGASKRCKIKFEETSIPVQNFQIPGFNIRLSIENEPPVNMAVIFGGDEVTLSAIQDHEGGVLYTSALLNWLHKIQIGDRMYSGFLIFKKEGSGSQSGLILESVVLRPGVVVSLDKKRDPICQLRTPKVVKLFDDGIMVMRENSVPGFIEQLYWAVPPFATCSADNVVE